MSTAAYLFTYGCLKLSCLTWTQNNLPKFRDRESVKDNFDVTNVWDAVMSAAVHENVIFTMLIIGLFIKPDTLSYFQLPHSLALVLYPTSEAWRLVVAERYRQFAVCVLLNENLGWKEPKGGFSREA